MEWFILSCTIWGKLYRLYKQNFWDEDPLYERIPDVPGISSLGLGNIDTVGGIALGAMAVGIAGHAATSAIQKKKRDAAEAKKALKERTVDK